MKEAIIIDLGGFYSEPELVPISTYGVTPIYEQPEPIESDEGEEEQEQAEPILVGYRVAVPVTPGLYNPKFDINAWQNAVEQYDDDFNDYLDSLAQYDEESEEDKPIPPVNVDLQSFWIEGLSEEELDEIRSRPIPKTTEQKLEETTVEIGLLSDKVNVKNADEIFNTLDIGTVTLEELKQKKIEQLNYLCNTGILSGYSSDALGTAHEYSFDYEAQINYAGMLNAINAGFILEPTTITWKTHLGNLPHTIDQFKQLYMDGIIFKQTEIGRYWTLKTNVESCESKEDVLEIEW